MDALRRSAAVNWDDESDEGEAAPPPPRAEKSKSGAHKKAAAPVPPRRGAPPARRGGSSEEATTSSSDGTRSESGDDTASASDSDVSEMSDGVAQPPAARPAARAGGSSEEEATTSSDGSDGSGSDDSDESPKQGARGPASGFARRGPPGALGAAPLFAPRAPPGAPGAAPRAAAPPPAPRVRASTADGVDWHAVAAALAAVPAAYKQPVFDPVPHVVEILNAADPEQELDKARPIVFVFVFAGFARSLLLPILLWYQLQDQQVAVEALVDDVVAGYHAGFSASIQNYSRILRLFEESRQLVTAVGHGLEDAGAHLASRRPALQAQWARAATSAAVVKLLDAAAHAAAYEDRVAAALRGDRPADAVAALLDAAAAVEREELRGVPGLRELRARMAERRSSLFADLLARLLRRIYAPEEASGAALLENTAPGAAGSSGTSSTASAPKAMTLNPLAAAAAAKALKASGEAAPAAAPGPRSFGGGVEGVRLGLERFSAAKAAADGARAAGADAGRAAQAGVEAAAAESEGGGSEVDAFVDALIRLSQGGGAVRDALSQRHPGQVRALVARHVARAAPRAGTASTVVSAPARSARAPSANDSPALDALEGACGALRSAMAALLRAQKRIVESPVAWAAVKGPLTGVAPSAAYADEAHRAWAATQAELERLLAALLAPPPPPPAALLRGSAAVAAQRAAAEAAQRAAAAQAAAAAAAGAAAAQAGPAFSFGLGTKLADAVAKPASSSSTQLLDGADAAGHGDAHAAPRGLDDDAYAAAAAALAGAGPALAPFATRPVLELADAIAARFPECTQAPGLADEAAAEAGALPAAQEAAPKKLSRSGSLSRTASMSRRLGRKAPSAPALGAT